MATQNLTDLRVGTDHQSPARRLIAAGIERGTGSLTYFGVEIVDPVTARFVVFFGSSPVWFNDHSDAADFAEKWNISAAKIHRTRSVGSL